jgi:hypothetical protein
MIVTCADKEVFRVETPFVPDVGDTICTASMRLWVDRREWTFLTGRTYCNLAVSELGK